MLKGIGIVRLPMCSEMLSVTEACRPDEEIANVHRHHDEARHDSDVDVRLVERARRGDGEALRRLWQANAPWLAAVLLAHKPASEDVDDLLQEVAVAMVRHIETLREPVTVRGWLRQVALNVARGAGRRRRRHSARVTHNGNCSTGVVDEIVQRESCRRMIALTEELPTAYREPLLLRAVNGLGAGQIASLLNISEASVHTRISRARQMLRELASRDEALVDVIPSCGAAAGSKKSG